MRQRWHPQSALRAAEVTELDDTDRKTILVAIKQEVALPVTDSYLMTPTPTRPVTGWENCIPAKRFPTVLN